MLTNFDYWSIFLDYCLTKSCKTAGGASRVRVRSEAWDGPQRGEGDSICESEAYNSL
jgi:hypothetical protein